MFLAVLIALSVSFLLILVRLIIGKTTYDRILAANSIGTIIVLAISVHGFYMGRPEFIDISIVYALINFIGTVAVWIYWSNTITRCFFSNTCSWND